MLTHGSLVEVMENSHRRILQLISMVDEDREIYPGWTTRELLAHLSGWDELVIDFLDALITGLVPAEIEGLDIDEYNVLSVKKRNGMNFLQLHQEYIDLRKKLLKLLSSVSLDQLDRQYILPWGETGTLVDVVNVFGPHESGHADDLDALIHKSTK